MHHNLTKLQDLKKEHKSYVPVFFGKCSCFHIVSGNSKMQDNAISRETGLGAELSRVDARQ